MNLENYPEELAYLKNIIFENDFFLGAEEFLKYMQHFD